MVESLKRISYENINQFLEDINRNFGLIENSPIYKGKPGDDGLPGDEGQQGKRGSNFLFVNLNSFIVAFPNTVITNTTITIEWLNVILNNYEERLKLLQALNIEYFINNDCVVLLDCSILQYNETNNLLTDTNIQFSDEIQLGAELQELINTYVEEAINNNQTLKDLKTIFTSYDVYEKPYSGIDNVLPGIDTTNSSSYVPYFPGVTNNDGTLLENYKYFGFIDKEFPYSNEGSIVFGSMENYCRLIQETFDITNQTTYTNSYIPSKTNTPSIVFLQNNSNNGIMFGRKDSINLSRFATIYKDSEDSVVFKSDMGDLITDYSKLILNRAYLSYNKKVLFEDNLRVSKDLEIIGNYNSKYIRTGEYILDKDLYSTPTLRNGILEIGVSTGILNQISDIIRFSKFKNNILLTDNDGNILKNYFLEKTKIPIEQISNQNLNDLIWDRGESNSENYLITSNFIEVLIAKINAIQQFVKPSVRYTNENPSLIKVGGVEIGTTFNNLTIQEVFTKMFYPELNPILTEPTLQFINSNSNATNLIEIGTTQNIAFKATTNRGSINPNYGTNGYRAGEVLRYVFTGENLNTTIETNQLIHTESRNILFSTLGLKTWTCTVFLNNGEQPKTSEGNNYLSPYLDADGITKQISIECVLPYYATTIRNIELTKQSLVSMSNKTFEVDLVAGTITNPQTIDYYSGLTDVDYIMEWDLVANDYVIPVNINEFVKTEIIYGSYSYKRYSQTVDAVGVRKLKFFLK